MSYKLNCSRTQFAGGNHVKVDALMRGGVRGCGQYEDLADFVDRRRGIEMRCAMRGGDAIQIVRKERT